MKVYTTHSKGIRGYVEHPSPLAIHIYQFQGQNLRADENHRVHDAVMVFVMPWYVLGTCPPFEKVKFLDPKKHSFFFLMLWLTLSFFDWFNNPWISAPGTASWTAHIVSCPSTQFEPSPNRNQMKSNRKWALVEEIQWNGKLHLCPMF